MKKFTKIISVLLGFSIIGGICYSYEAMALKENIKEKSENASNENTKTENKKNFFDLKGIKNKIEKKANKIKNKINKTKKDIKKNTNNIKNNIDNNVNKLKNDVKDSTEKMKKNVKNNAKKIKEKINKNKQIINENKDKKQFEDNITNFNSNFIPISIKSTSSSTKAVVVDVLINKLFNENKLDKNMLNYDQNKPNLNYNLFSIMLNKNFIPGINIITNKENLKEVTKIVNSNEFKKFVENIKISEKDFNESKERLQKYLEQEKQNIEKNIADLKNEKNNKVDLSNLLSDAKNQKEINNKIYNEGIREFLKKYDNKLYEKVEARIENSAFDGAFFRDSLKYSKEFLIKKLSETLEKIKSKNGLIDEIDKLKYNEEIENLKIKSENIEQDNLNNNKRGRINLFGTERINKYFLYSPEIISYGYFEALRLDDDEKQEFKKYYKEKLENIKIKNNENNLNIKEIIDLYYGNNSFLKKHLSKEEYEKQKKEIMREENAKNFANFTKDVMITYYETFVNKLS